MAEDYIESGSKEESTGYGAQLSLKFGNGGMINVRASDVNALVSEVENLALVGTYIVNTSEEIQSAAISAQQAQANVVQQFPQTTVVQQGPPPQQGGGQQKFCAHGQAMAFRAGTSKAGKPYSGYFCQVKNDPYLAECPPQFNR